MEYRIKKESDEKFGDWQEFTVKAKWTGGIMFNSMELATEKKIDNKEVKNPIKPGLGFFGTPTIPFWIGLVVIIVAIGALIWWWIASSKKEDKEEESL